MIALTAARKEAFETKVFPHLDSLYRYALRLSGNSADAEDLVQECMLRAYRAWDRFEEGGNVRGWLMTILRNTFLNEHRRDRRAGVVADVMEVEHFAIFDQVQETDPEGAFFEQLVDDDVWKAIDSLPREFREAVLLRDVEGMSYDEIAQMLGVKIGTVKSRLFRARQALQSVLYEYAVEMGHLPRNAGVVNDASRREPTSTQERSALQLTDRSLALACT